MKRTRWLLSAAAWLVSLLACVSAQCIDNDKKLKKMMPGAPACARIAARSLCSHDTGDGTTIADLNVCQCSCPLPPPPTTCAGGGNSSGTLRPDDAQCCNVARWRDNEGATCKDYVENGWCCSASNRGCNAQSSLPSGLDSDHGCCEGCANQCSDDDHKMRQRLQSHGFKIQDIAPPHSSICEVITRPSSSASCQGDRDEVIRAASGNLFKSCAAANDLLKHTVFGTCARASAPRAITLQRLMDTVGLCANRTRMDNISGVINDNATFADICCHTCPTQFKTRHEHCAHWQIMHPALADINTTCSCSCKPDILKPPHPPSQDESSCSDGLRNGNETHIDCGGHKCRACKLGCTISAAQNFNASATDDDGSCTFTFHPCTDKVAANYDPNAIIDYSSNRFPRGACKYTLQRIVNAIATLPCANLAPDFSIKSKAQLRASLATEDIDEWETPCFHTSGAAGELLRRNRTIFYSNLSQLHKALTHDEASLPAKAQQVHVVQFAESEILPKWKPRTLLVHNHTAAILHGNPTRPYFNAGWHVIESSFLAVRFVTFGHYTTHKENQGEDGSGAAISLSDGVAQITSCHFVQMTAENNGGAVSVESSSIYIERSLFSRCNARIGGAIWAAAATRAARTIINNCTFDDNRAQETERDSNEREHGVGGAIFAQGADVMVFDSVFRHNKADPDTVLYMLSGRDLFLASALRVVIENTRFVPFSKADSVRFVASYLSDCSTRPCTVGHKCSVGDQFRTCDKCPAGSSSPLGVACKPCEAGQEANHNRTACIPCAVGNYSRKYMLRCHRCKDGTYSKQGSSVCSRCPSTVFSFRSHFIDKVQCSGTVLPAGRPCAAGYNGTLCLACADGYRQLQDDTCGPCEQTGSAYRSYLVQQAVVIVALVSALLAAVYCLQRKMPPETESEQSPTSVGETSNPVASLPPLLAASATAPNTRGAAELRISGAQSSTSAKLHIAWRAAFQPIRIVIIYIQVTSHLGAVLHIDYPTGFKQIMEELWALLDIFSIVFSPDCSGLSGFQYDWFLRVICLPLVLAILVMLRFFTERKSQSHTSALQNMKGNALFCIFFAYPNVCNTVFSAFNCIDIPGGKSILAVDDRLFCEQMPWIQAVSMLMIVTVGFGVPLAFGGVLLVKTRKDSTKHNHSALVIYVADTFKVSRKVAAYAVRDLMTIGTDYGFLMDGYLPRFLWWESFDMFRKLFLVGIIIFVGRGSIYQIVCAAFMSTCFLALQLACRPYKIRADNVLRIVTEIHVYIVVLAAFLMHDAVLTHLGEDTVNSSVDWVLITTFVLCVPLAFITTVCCKVQAAMRYANGTDVNAAFGRFLRGLASEADCRKLRSCFDDELDRHWGEARRRGRRLWKNRTVVSHLSTLQMKALLSSIEQRLPKTHTLGFHFTDRGSAKLILRDGKGIRSSDQGQLGGGVSICLSSPVQFGWDVDCTDCDAEDGFPKRLGDALWGSKWQEVMPTSGVMPAWAERWRDDHGHGLDTWGKYADKLETVLVLRIPAQRNPEHIVPHREDVYIIPKTMLVPEKSDGRNYVFSNAHVEALLLLKSRDMGPSANPDILEAQQAPTMSPMYCANFCEFTDMPTLSELHQLQAKPKEGRHLQIENVARFTRDEMRAVLQNIDRQILHSYVLAFYFTSKATADQLVSGDRPDDTIVVLPQLTTDWVPLRLGWQPHSRGQFKHNVKETLQNDEKMDIMFILALHGSVLTNTRSCEGERADLCTCTLDYGPELADDLRVHVEKAYELE